MVPVVTGFFVSKQMWGFAQEFVDPSLSSHRKLEACYYKGAAYCGGKHPCLPLKRSDCV